MSFFVGGHTLRLTAGRAFRCPFLENQLAGLSGHFSFDGSFVIMNIVLKVLWQNVFSDKYLAENWSVGSKMERSVENK